MPQSRFSQLRYYHSNGLCSFSMSQTYTAMGINLKSIPLGESDRILTILTREWGLIRAVAPGARKPKAKLGGRGDLFVVNQLMLSKGRSLDKIAQAESLESYPALSRNLAKLTVGQYWAEMILYQTPSHDAEGEVFDWICQRLKDLAACDSGLPVLVHLLYGMAQLLNLEGILPQIEHCCVSGQAIDPDAIGNGRVVFSPALGGIALPTSDAMTRPAAYSVQEQPSPYCPPQRRSVATVSLSATEVLLVQQLFRVRAALPQHHPPPSELLTLTDAVQDWLSIEQAFRAYVQYHTERPIRSATLLDSCFSPLTAPAVAPPAVSAVRP